MACNICKAPNAPLGYGYAGFRKDRPTEAILWCCTDPACKAAAELRWQAANAGRTGAATASAGPRLATGAGKDGHEDVRPDRKGRARGDKRNSEQKDLFG